MHDPFPIPAPAAVAKYVTPIADYLSLKTLPLHIHEVAIAFLLYYTINKVAAPLISNLVIPREYKSFNARTKLNWDVHIVSFTQSTLICALALWVMWKDEERAEMNWLAKVHGYTGASGLIQAFAGGYFVWDLMITLQNLSVFGPGMLAHAVSALFVFSLGFRPFVNYYGPTFILYELSSPFLNVHWFCDKLNMTGSKIQLYNGILLLLTFFSCRIAWGSYQSARVFYDVYRAIFRSDLLLSDAEYGMLDNGTDVPIPRSEIMQFAGDRPVPVWLAACYLGANLTLNGLNWFWFGKMIETLRKRFDPPLGTKKAETEDEKVLPREQVLVEGTHVETPPPSRPLTPLPVQATGNDTDFISAVKLEKSGTHLEAERLEVRSRREAVMRRAASAA